jgi:hypothetical protein
MSEYNKMDSTKMAQTLELLKAGFTHDQITQMMTSTSSNKNTPLTIDEMREHLKSTYTGSFYTSVRNAREKIPKNIRLFIIYVVELKKGKNMLLRLESTKKLVLKDDLPENLKNPETWSILFQEYSNLYDMKHEKEYFENTYIMKTIISTIDEEDEDNEERHVLRNDKEIDLYNVETEEFFKMKAMQHYFASVDDYLKNLK